MYNNLFMFIAKIIMKFLNKYFRKHKLEQTQTQEKPYFQIIYY
jgi:hypothetical protein